MSDRDSDIGAFLAGFVVGGLVGAVAALLLAPQSGEETRTLIRDKSIELKTQVEETAADARAKAERIAHDAKSRAEDLQRRGQVLLDEQKARLGGKKGSEALGLTADDFDRRHRRGTQGGCPFARQVVWVRRR